LPPLSEIIPPFLVLIASLSFHEAAHAWMADRLGDPTARSLGRLTLNPIAHVDVVGTILFPLVAMLSGLPLLGWAKPVPVDPRNLRAPRRDFAIVAAAGPASNLVLATLAAIVLMAVQGSHPGIVNAGDWVTRTLFMMVVINVLLAVFNMIPVPPLDGGNVAMGLLPAPAARVIAQLRPFGFLILYALMLSGVLYTIVEPINRAILRVLL